jgi:hypothetical protein
MGRWREILTLAREDSFAVKIWGHGWLFMGNSRLFKIVHGANYDQKKPWLTQVYATVVL